MTTITEKGEFKLLEAATRKIIAGRRDAWRTLYKLRDEHIRLKGELEQREAQVRAEGIEGKNAEERNANLLLALEKDETYQSRAADVRSVQRDIWEAEGLLTELDQEFSTNKRLMDFATAYLRMTEVVFGGRE